MMPRPQWMALITLLALSCRHHGAASGGFQDIYPRAQTEARTTVQGEVADVPVVVHATAPFDAHAARRFLVGVEDYW